MMNAAKTCLQKYMDFSGRAARAEFWWFFLFLLALHVVAIIVNSALFGPTLTQEFRYSVNSSGDATARLAVKTVYNGGIFTNAIFVLTFLPFLSVTWRRMHDIGKRGFWALLPWVFTALTYLMMALTFEEQPVDWNDSNLPEGVILPDTISVPQSWALVLTPVLLAVASSLVVLWWLRTKSQPGSNPYGPNPNEAPS